MDKQLIQNVLEKHQKAHPSSAATSQPTITHVIQYLEEQRKFYLKNSILFALENMEPNQRLEQRSFQLSVNTSVDAFESLTARESIAELFAEMIIDKGSYALDFVAYFDGVGSNSLTLAYNTDD